MKHFIVRIVWIVKLTALALAFCFLQPSIQAQGTPDYIVIFPSVGLAPGQKLRLTLFNPAGDPVRAQAQIHHSGGIIVGMGDGSVRLVRGGTFHSFDLNRSDILASGEEGTGRLQLRASCHIRMAQPWRRIDGLAVSMETIEIVDGTSNTILVGEVIHHPVGGGGNDVLVGGDARDVLMGIVPGQTLRATIFNPPLFDAGDGSRPQDPTANGHVKIFDQSGILLAQSDNAVIQPGDFRSFDFDRDAFSSPGETGTLRQQVRVNPFFEFRSQRLSRVLASFEIVDNRTGKTEVLSGDQCLVFFLGGIPDN